MFGLDAMSGALSWRFRPTIDPAYGDKDLDFGASPNLYTTRGGRDITGNGRKDAVYYARDRASGAPVFSSLTGQPGITGSDFSVGGFLGTPAVQRDGAGRAVAIVGTTAIPVPFDSDADGSNQRPGDVQRTITAVRAIDPADGHLLWAYQLDGPSYGGVSIANGVALVPDTFGSNLLALDIATGRPLAMLPVPAPPSSTPVAVGDSVYMGGGTRTTDAEYKSFGNDLQTLGNHPLSPVSGVFAFRVAAP
jgi:hypothetical protein